MQQQQHQQQQTIFSHMLVAVQRQQHQKNQEVGTRTTQTRMVRILDARDDGVDIVAETLEKITPSAQSWSALLAEVWIAQVTFAHAECLSLVMRRTMERHLAHHLHRIQTEFRRDCL